MSKRTAQRFCAFLAVSAAALAGAAAADAATVSVSLDSPSDGTLVYQAPAGEANHVTVEQIGDPATFQATWQVTETGAPLIAGQGCTSLDAQTASCTAPPGPFAARRVAITLGDLDDWASAAKSCLYHESDLGEIDAFCFTTIDGGAGSDTLIGNESFWLEKAVLSGGEGDDVLRGGAGDDVVYAGGGNDTVYGESTACSVFQRGSGDDRIYGQAGNDHLHGCGGNNVIYGGVGSDLLVGKDGADRLYGIDQADLIYGGLGNDTIGGGRGQDDLRGQQGNDTFYARDRQADRIVGWTGFDRAQIDRGLDRRSSIERLF